MNFELLDSILEGAQDIDNLDAATTPDNPEEIEKSKENEIYSDVDTMVEAAMHEALRNTIMESTVNPATKLQHIMITESTDFTEDQMEKFMHETIHPILTFCGMLQEGIDYNKAVTTNFATYALVNVLEDADNGVHAEDSPEYDELTNEVLNKEGEVDEKSLGEALVGVFEAFNISESDRETMLEEAIELRNSGVKVLPNLDEVAGYVFAYNLSNTNMPLTDLAESYGLFCLEEDLKSAVDIATKGIGKVEEKLKTETDPEKKKGLMMRLKALKQRIADAKKKWQEKRVKAAELKKRPEGWHMGKKPEGAGATKLVHPRKPWTMGQKADDKATELVHAGKGGRVRQLVSKAKAKWGALSKGKKAGVIAGLAAAAIATAAAIAYRKKKDKCSGLEGDAKANCQKQAVQAAIAAIKSQASKCGSDEKCKAKAQKQIDKWKARM